MALLLGPRSCDVPIYTVVCSETESVSTQGHYCQLLPVIAFLTFNCQPLIDKCGIRNYRNSAGHTQQAHGRSADVMLEPCLWDPRQAANLYCTAMCKAVMNRDYTGTVGRSKDKTRSNSLLAYRLIYPLLEACGTSTPKSMEMRLSFYTFFDTPVRGR